MQHIRTQLQRGCRADEPPTTPRDYNNVSMTIKLYSVVGTINITFLQSTGVTKVNQFPR